jgi:hypothetical protein
VHLAYILLKISISENPRNLACERDPRSMTGRILVEVIIQLNGANGSQQPRPQVLRYDVQYDQRLGVARWQLVPGQGELVFTSVANSR